MSKLSQDVALQLRMRSFADLCDCTEHAHVLGIVVALRDLVTHFDDELLLEPSDELAIATKDIGNDTHALHAAVDAAHEQIQMLVYLQLVLIIAMHVSADELAAEGQYFHGFCMQTRIPLLVFVDIHWMRERERDREREIVCVCWAED